MNALKHMEAVFIVALSLAGTASYLAATSQDAQAQPAPAARLNASAAVPVITVLGKRMSEAEKAASARQEAAGRLASNHP